LQQFWKNDFMPLPPWGHWDWLGAAYLKLLSAITGIFLPLPSYFVLLYSITIIFGIILIARDNDKNRFTTSVILTSIPLMMIASALHLYPIKGRFLLFLAPFMFLLMANGLEQICLLVGKWNWPVARILGLLLMLGIVWEPARLVVQNWITPPLEEHIKPGLAYMQENWQDGDIIYVYYGGKPAFEYYRASFGFDTANLINGVMSQDDPGKYIQDIKKLRGSDRVWFIFTHNCDACIVHEQKHYLRYLNKIGTLISKFHGQGVNVYLYDLNP
jgi:hypothetical protein